MINPNNPTGAVYPEAVLRELADIAREHGLVVMADEIYDKILYDDAVHVPFARIAPDVFTLTFNGLSKAYRVAGFRSGWMMVTGPEAARDQLPRGHHDPGQHAAVRQRPGPARVQVALGGRQSIRDLVLPGGRLREQRDAAVARAARDPRRHLRRPEGRAVRVPAARPGACTRSRTTSSSCSNCCAPSTSWWCRAAGFNWPHAGPPAHRHPAAGRRPDRRDRAASATSCTDYHGEY